MVNVCICENGQKIMIRAKSIFRDSFINLCFDRLEQSHSAYNKIRGMSMKCYHVGVNAPGGPYVALPFDYKENIECM